MIDIEKVRADTILSPDQLFLNSAGSSLPPKPVLDVVLKYLQEEARVGGYAYADAMLEEIGAFYEVVATLLNTQSRNVAMAVSATDAYIRALSAIPFSAGDVILTTDDDYVSNHLHFLSLQKRFGVRIVRGRTESNGDLDLEDFERQIVSLRPKLVAATHVPTSSGLVQDIEGLGAICSKHDCLYLVDACQSVGQMPVDVRRIQCDFLSATGRKFLRGPRGTGFLYISDRVLESGMEPMFPDLQGADWTAAGTYRIQRTAKRFELWEWQYATIVGLRDAVRYALDIGLGDIYEYNQQLLQQLTNRLASVDGVTQYDRGSSRANIVTFRKEGLSKEGMTDGLRSAGVSFSVAERSSAQFDFEKKGVDWAIRISPHYFNTLDEIDTFVGIVQAL